MDIGHLVITRKTGQAIVVDGPATIEVVSIKGKQIKLKVIAEKSVSITRQDMKREAA